MNDTRPDPVVAVEAQREIERLIGRLVVQNTTLTAQLGRLTDQLAAAQAALAEARPTPAPEEAAHGS